jgi:hypothetical protein
MPSVTRMQAQDGQHESVRHVSSLPTPIQGHNSSYRGNKQHAPPVIALMSNLVTRTFLERVLEWKRALRPQRRSRLPRV